MPQATEAQGCVVMCRNKAMVVIVVFVFVLGVVKFSSFGLFSKAEFFRTTTTTLFTLAIHASKAS